MQLDYFLKYFVPKDKSFFPLFEQAAKNLSLASKLLVDFLNEDDSSQRDKIIYQIEDIEHKSDLISNNVFEQLNNNFITPFERDDIHLLTSTIDQVLDNINGASRKFRLFKPKAIIPVFKEMAEIIYLASLEIEISIYNLRNAGANRLKILDACINLNTLENKADDIYHQGISDIFENEKNAKELIKNKSILETLEKCVDCAEDISDIIKGILVKMS